MKADGTIWIDTKIDESGMEDGFNRIRDGADDVAVSFRNAGKAIEKSFSNINFNKTIENLKSQIRSLEAEFDSISREFEDAVKLDDDKAAERLGAKRTRIYDRIARAREKLAVEVAAAAQKEAAAEEKASQRVIAAEEKEAAKKRTISSELRNAGDSASYFGNRLRGIVSSALVFNVISSGLKKVTSYFGTALMANNQFSTAVNRLKGSLMVAFQPIYESVLPALITLINWLNVAVQAVARFFSILAGKSYSQMQSNAESLNSTMNNMGNTSGTTSDAVEDMGDSIQDTANQAKKAEKYLAGFDEINRMLSEDAENASNSLGNASDSLGNVSDSLVDTDNFQAPIFEEVELPTEWETAIDKLAMRFKDIFFEWDNLNPEIITEKLLTALTTVAGGLIGFALGGPGGALIGMIVGAGLGVVLSSIIFDGDGKLSTQEILQTLLAVLGIIGGGLIGFALGGPAGALIGVTIGAGLTFMLFDGVFDNDGALTYEELEKSLLAVILTFGGAGLGFALGGPGGALIGLTIGAGLSFILAKADITHLEGTITTDELINSLLNVLIVIGGTAIGFMLGGPGGAVIGALVGLGLTFALAKTSFKPVEDEYTNLNKKVAQWSRETTETTENEFIEPTKSGMNLLTNHISDRIEEAKTSIEANMELAATSTDTTFFTPVAKWSTQLSETLQKQNTNTAEKIVKNMESAGNLINERFIAPLRVNFDNLGDRIEERFQNVKSRVTEVFQSLAQWFSEKVTGRIYEMFNTMVSNIIAGLNQLAQAIASLLSNYNSTRSTISSGTTTTTSTYTVASASYAATPQIPYLARGAVIPANAPFLAVLGDQRHGTNVEAPLETIQEAVALVMDDVVQSNLTGFEAVVTVLQEILETILGIEIGDQVIAEAVQRYQTKMAVVRGG